MLHIFAVCLQGIRIAIPAVLYYSFPADTVRNFLESMPPWLTDGMAIGGGMVVAVGYALVINMMATKEVWPFFIIGFVVATDFSININRIRCFRCRFSSYLLELI